MFRQLFQWDTPNVHCDKMNNIAYDDPEFLHDAKIEKKPVFSNTGINAGKVPDIIAEYVFLFS